MRHRRLWASTGAPPQRLSSATKRRKRSSRAQRAALSQWVGLRSGGCTARAAASQGTFGRAARPPPLSPLWPLWHLSYLPPLPLSPPQVHPP